ncbi:Arylsulfotransferase-domain-containing protein [Xylariaceae sp. FL0255]|nr:Arylsulfotransferase-domain-containing protein [Xylariaceae sp. FL0255]
MLSLFFLLLRSALLHGQPASCDHLISDYEGYNNAEYGIFPRLEFKSIDLDAPQLQVSVWNKDAMSKRGSHIFIRHDGNHDHPLDSSPLILDAEDLSVVYLNRSFDAVFDVRVQQDHGKNYLTFYGGPMTEIGLGNGYAHAYDEHYNEVYSIAPQKLSVKGDLHECQFSGNGTAMVTAYERKSWNLQKFRGSKHGMILDSVFQEVELETNKVLFQWRASEHIRMEASFEHMHPQRWDFFHLNSIQKTRAGNYLLCARHTHAVYLVNGTDGSVIWTLGGKDNEFIELRAFADNSTREASSPVLSMAWQHHARFYMDREDEITLFDNHVLDFNGYNCTVDCSRAIHFKIDAENKTVRLLNEYTHPQSLQSQSQGSVQVMEDNENVFVGWGRNPSFTEHTKDGEVVLSVQFGPWRSTRTQGEGLDNYRAYRMDWKATPYWPPDILVEREGGNGSDVAYVSWNGATEVKHWALVCCSVFFCPRLLANVNLPQLASDSPADLDGPANVVARAHRSGFETVVALGSNKKRYVRVAALDINHAIIGSSRIFDVMNGTTIESNLTITSVREPSVNSEVNAYHQGVLNGMGVGVGIGLVVSAIVMGSIAYLTRSAWVQTQWECRGEHIKGWFQSQARGEYMRIPWRQRRFGSKSDEETASIVLGSDDDDDNEGHFHEKELPALPSEEDLSPY